MSSVVSELAYERMEFGKPKRVGKSKQWTQIVWDPVEERGYVGVLEESELVNAILSWKKQPMKE